ncbi:MAG: hypothetical protein HYT03_00030, partial [Candidatus Harrisonbacteria bacterium]|nr:hypothetical protein [Candidatus Harrisonbacteria bacterium]
MNQKGFAPILVIGIIVAVIVIGTGGFYVSKQNEGSPTESSAINEPTNGTPIEKQSETQKTTTAPEPTPTSAITKEPDTVPQSACSRIFSPQYGAGPQYTGPLFDAHFHLPSFLDYTKITGAGHDGINFNSVTSPILDKDIMLADIICTLKKEKVRGIIGFGIGSEEVTTETLQSAKSIRQRAAEFIHIFLSPVGFSATALENIQISNAGLLGGYGELSFGFGGGLQPNQYPDDQNFLDVYKVAGKYDLVMMIHIGAQQQNRIENVLQKNPSTKFLFHGPESENFIHTIIGKYPNAYYSIDAMLIRLPGAPGALMYMVNSKDE